MNRDRLYAILSDCTAQYRPGPSMVSSSHSGHVDVHEIFLMSHGHEMPPNMERVDMTLLIVGVDTLKAEQHRAEFIDILNDWPAPERLAGGPSYIEVGAVLGDQGAAFQMFALGKALGLWTVITPETIGLEGAEAVALAGRGFVMMSGYSRPKENAA